MVGHVAPEAVRGGPLALVREGDEIEIDVDARSLQLAVDAGELAARAAGARSAVPSHPGRVFAKYAAAVGSASRGAITSPVVAP
jgi:dihydroxy-acid dehydratase